MNVLENIFGRKGFESKEVSFLAIGESLFLKHAPLVREPEVRLPV